MSRQTSLLDYFVNQVRTSYDTYIENRDQNTLNLFNVGLQQGKTLEEWTDFWIAEAPDGLSFSQDVYNKIQHRANEWIIEGQNLEQSLQHSRWEPIEREQIKSKIMEILRRVNYLKYLFNQKFITVDPDSIYIL